MFKLTWDIENVWLRLSMETAYKVVTPLRLPPFPSIRSFYRENSS